MAKFLKDFQTRNRRSFEKLDSSVPLKKIKKDIETGRRVGAAKLKYEERLADKRRRGAPKREAKARAKAIENASIEEREKIEAEEGAKKTIEAYNRRKAVMK